MPYIISPPIKLGSPGEWREGSAYEKENLYEIKEGKLPPVNYDKHILKPHSLCHIETPLHTQKEGKSISDYFKSNPSHFYGKCVVLKFENAGVSHQVIEVDELKAKLSKYNNVEKVLVTIDGVKENEFGYHDPNLVLTLSLEAARYLTSLEGFNLFGTTWKSSDYMPGSSERPIHNELFKKALILENINLNEVPEGEYSINCFPLNLEGASESPVTAVLFEIGEQC